MPEAGRHEEPQSSGAVVRGFLKSGLQTVGIFLFINFATRQFMEWGAQPKTQPSVPGADVSAPATSSGPGAMNHGVTRSLIPQIIYPLWPSNSSIDLSIYVSPSLAITPFDKLSSDAFVVQEKAFRMGDWKENREIDTSFAVPKEVQNNATLWAHFLVAQSGSPMDPTAAEYDWRKAFHFVRPLTQYLPVKRVAKTRNLLTGADEEHEVEQPAIGRVIASHYHPNFTVSVIPDFGTPNYEQVHPAVRQWVNLEPTGVRDTSGQNGWYFPIVYLNTFWQLRNQMMAVNTTTTRLPLHITLNNLANWKFSLLATMDEGMKQQARQVAAGNTGITGSDGSELEDFKRILLESNPYLLATTGVVSVLHMIFELLAFKSDVSHWRNKKDNVGVSVRTILANVFMQTVIFLYLMDNNESTSWMILFGQGMGILIEAWKITKTVDVRVRPAPPGSFLPYSIVFEDKHKLSETEQKTKEYDEIAFKYLYIIAVPLLLAYAGYSLYYETHKSWYSYIIATLVGSVYAYGFLMMLPSLYINYRLQSVAHMPAKTMTYKFLNTFIDDLFAFTIKMPTLHRLATLRDDLVFFVYLYQGWKYKVDYSRVNEFGQGGDDEAVEEKVAGQPLKAPPDAKEAPTEAVKIVKDSHAKVTGRAKGEGRKRK